jgi:hypothetical protein
MFNPIIIAALLVQTFVANFSRTAGAHTCVAGWSKNALS